MQESSISTMEIESSDHQQNDKLDLFPTDPAEYKRQIVSCEIENKSDSLLSTFTKRNLGEPIDLGLKLCELTFENFVDNLSKLPLTQCKLSPGGFFTKVVNSKSRTS